MDIYVYTYKNNIFIYYVYIIYMGSVAGFRGRVPWQGPVAGSRGRVPRQGPAAGSRGIYIWMLCTYAQVYTCIYIY